MAKEKQRIDAEGTCYCLLALLCWASGPVFIKLLSFSLDSWTQNFYRYCVACLFWLGFLCYKYYQKEVQHSIWRKAILPATVNIIMQSFWVTALYYINPAFMILLSKSSILWIILFSMVLFADERQLLKSKFFWFGFILAVLGLMGVIIFKKDFATETNLAGIGFTIAAAFFWGIYTVSVKAVFKGIDVRVAFSVISIYTVIGLGVLAFIFGEPGTIINIPFKPWIYIVVSGVVSIALSHTLYYAAIIRIGATITSLVLLSHPLLVFAISAVIFEEKFSCLQWISGMVLLTGAAVAIYSKRFLINSK